MNVRADLEGGRALKWYMKKAARGRKQDGAGSGELPIVGGVSGTGCGKRRFRESAEVLGAGNGGLGRVRRFWVREKVGRQKRVVHGKAGRLWEVSGTRNAGLKEI